MPGLQHTGITTILVKYPQITSVPILIFVIKQERLAMKNCVISKQWIWVGVAFVIGSSMGTLATRWHYKSLYKDSVNCGSVDHYDKTGKKIL